MASRMNKGGRFIFRHFPCCDSYYFGIDSSFRVCPFRSIFINFRDKLFETISIFSYIRSEEHTSELQSLRHLVCRLLLEKHTEFLLGRQGQQSGRGRRRTHPPGPWL